MGSAEGSEHQAKEANANLGVPRIARVLDRDLPAWLVCLLRDDRKLGLRHRGAKAALRDLLAVKTVDLLLIGGRSGSGHELLANELHDLLSERKVMRRRSP